ncbi:hypothetical protein Ancab_023549 [Ancistrocladus abbreviatus]
MEQGTSVGDDVGEVETLQEFLNCISQLPADSSVHLSPVRIIFKAPPAGKVDRKELTVEIPTEQLPEGATSEVTPATSSLPGSSSTPPEPDLEFLAFRYVFDPPMHITWLTQFSKTVRPSSSSSPCDSLHQKDAERRNGTAAEGERLIRYGLL